MSVGKKLIDRSAQVVIVESSSSSRGVMGDIVKQLGFKEVQFMDTVKSVLSYLEVEKADWVIAPLGLNQGVTLMHVLELAGKFKKLGQVLYSALIEPEQLKFLPKCFEMGLFSYHDRQFTKDSLKNELSEVLNKISDFQGDVVLSASTYAEKALKSSDSKSSLVSLFERLVDFYPNSKEIFIAYAKAQLFAERKDEAKRLLGLARRYGYEEWAQVAEEYFPAEEIPDVKFEIKEVVVVDPDEQMQEQLKRAISKISTSEIKLFRDGKEAFDYLVDAKPDLLIQEWAVPKLTGAFFLQRIRSLGHHLLPIVVHSSRISKQDLPLLTEMGVTGIIEKQPDEAPFLQSLEQLLQEERNPENLAVMERRIQQLLLAGKIQEAAPFLNQFQNHPRAHRGQIKLMQGMYFYAKEEFETAKIHLIEAIKLDADPIRSLTLLGRIFARLKNFYDAARCLQKAQELSPKNVQRLCEIAEAQFELEDRTQAFATVERAQMLDAGSDQVLSAQAQFATRDGDVSKASGIISSMARPACFVADMNNTAVAYVHADSFERGLQLYGQTLAAIPEQEKELKAKVSYNLALGLVKASELEGALNVINETQWEQFGIGIKAKALRDKIESALKHQSVEVRLVTGTPVTKKPTVLDELDQSLSHRAMTPIGEEKQFEQEIYQPRMGDFCCLKFFTVSEAIDAEVKGAMAGPPPFKPRSALQRQESFGAERERSK